MLPLLFRLATASCRTERGFVNGSALIGQRVETISGAYVEEVRIGERRSVADRDECASLCAATDGCVAFQINAQRGKCELLRFHLSELRLEEDALWTAEDGAWFGAFAAALSTRVLA